MITRIHGCILEQQNKIANDSIDLLLTDPPYNISENGAHVEWTDSVTGENKNKIHSQRFDDNFEHDWDSVEHTDFVKQLIDWSEVWSKKLRKGGTFAIFISDRYLSYLWQALIDCGLEPKRVITWKKPAAVPFNRAVNPVSGCEFIVWGIKPGGRRTFNSTVQSGSRVERFSIADKISSLVHKHIRESTDADLNIEKIFNEAKKEAQRVIDDRKQKQGLIECVIPNTITYSGGLGKDKIHPTQKPEEVLKYLIDLCSNPGDTVLDTFAGSGSTGMAAWALNRHAILVERDAVMFDLMNQRFEQIDRFE
jgi:site-specific DNA-methyltransferase (adenine-specific)